MIYIRLLLLFSINLVTAEIPSSHRAELAFEQLEKPLKSSFSTRQLQWGAAVYMRIFKQSNELELWVQKGAEFVLYNTYPICSFSGSLGPKLATGDLQSPEGFYFVKPIQLNPWSRFHLSFNLGYPNAYDRAHGRTGSALMVHGDCVSVGCYAMTDPQIEEIYSLMVASFKGGQPFIRVHAFPFRMDEKNMDKHKNNPWYSFWQNLKSGYDFFEINKKPPNVEIMKGQYVFN